MDLYLLKFPYRRMLDPLAKSLSWVDPDHVSYAATLVAMGTALCLINAAGHHWLLLVGIVTIFLRMTLNTIDGVMAIARGKKTLVGEVVNALPDRYSDVFLMLGFVFSPLCDQTLAIIAMVTVWLVSYTGMLGKAVGVSWQHQGPLGKVERLITVMVFMLLQYLFGSLTLFGITYSYLSWAMVVFIVLGQFAVMKRLGGQLREILIREWPASAERAAVAGKVLIVYDSATGNTRAIAEKIAEACGGTAVRVDDAPAAPDHSLIVLCSPNIRGRCTPKLKCYVDKLAGETREYALAITYGAPLWGYPTAVLAAWRLKQELKGRCRGVFVCKGYHAKYKTYAGHPDEKEKTDALVFGMELGRELARRTHG